MKTVLSIITIYFLLLFISVPLLYFYSPQAEVSALRAENDALRQQISGNESELIAVVVSGMLLVTIACLGFFLCLLCILSKTRPAEFFTHRGYHAIPADRRPQIEQKPAETFISPTRDDRHSMVM